MSITPQDFIRRWGTDDEALVKLPTQSPRGLTIPDDARNFLTKAGLPASAAPFLGFEQLGGGLKSVREHLRGASGPAAELPMLGADGSGNPICLAEGGEVVLLDPEKAAGPTFMNSSVAHLAACLLASRAVYEMDGLPHATVAEMYAKNIAQADARAVEPGSFWWSETRMFADEEE